MNLKITSKTKSLLIGFKLFEKQGEKKKVFFNTSLFHDITLKKTREKVVVVICCQSGNIKFF